MRTILNKLIMFCCMALWAPALSAQQSHWSVDPHGYQYDMTVYFSLMSGATIISDAARYEVAAFVGSECRGIGTFESHTAGDTTINYGYMRVYSNTQDGGTVTFKVYDRQTQEETLIKGVSIPFVSAKAVGYPSEPTPLNLDVDIIQGDADGDGRITINDAVLTINATFGNDPSGFSRAAADMDGDGRVTINDAILIINQTF